MNYTETFYYNRQVLYLDTPYTEYDHLRLSLAKLRDEINDTEDKLKILKYKLGAVQDKLQAML